MQFKVPQFIDIEDKIFGPLTFSQFAYLAGGAGISFFLYKLLGLTIGFIPIAFIISFALALSFYKPNNKPFSDMVQAALIYFFQDKLYIWQRKKITKKEKQDIEQKNNENLVVHNPRLNKSKLRDISWGLDVLDFKK